MRTIKTRTNLPYSHFSRRIIDANVEKRMVWVRHAGYLFFLIIVTEYFFGNHDDKQYVSVFILTIVLAKRQVRLRASKEIGRASFPPPPGGNLLCCTWEWGVGISRVTSASWLPRERELENLLKLSYVPAFTRRNEYKTKSTVVIYRWFNLLDSSLRFNFTKCFLHACIQLHAYSLCSWLYTVASNVSKL